jgi:hypothetical protein
MANQENPRPTVPERQNEGYTPSFPQEPIEKKSYTPPFPERENPTPPPPPPPKEKPE